MTRAKYFHFNKIVARLNTGKPIQKVKKLENDKNLKKLLKINVLFFHQKTH